MKMGSGNMFVLYDRKAVHELLDKKGNIYSERPFDHVAQLVTNGDSFAFMGSNDTLWRNQRKIASHALAVSTIMMALKVERTSTKSMQPRQVDEKIAPLQEAEYGFPFPVLQCFAC